MLTLPFKYEQSTKQQKIVGHNGEKDGRGWDGALSTLYLSASNCCTLSIKFRLTH